jgi:hypothetical protein
MMVYQHVSHEANIPSFVLQAPEATPTLFKPSLEVAFFVKTWGHFFTLLI